MKIPKIIHQTWKTKEIPKKWAHYQQGVIDLHPGWEYWLWTDDEIDDFVKKEYNNFYPTFLGFQKNIMRIDVVRYLIMDKIGGYYLDLDYELLKPFDFENEVVILPKNRGIEFGDAKDVIGNSIFGSIPGHIFWKDVIDDLKKNPPQIKDYLDVEEATGPHFLTRIYNSNKIRYKDVYILNRKYYHFPISKRGVENEKLGGREEIYGLHHCAGSWRERYTWPYFKMKIRKIFI